MSKRSQALGQEAERLVQNLYHASARERRVADLRKIPTDTMVIDGRMVHKKKSTVDHLGFLFDGTGRIVSEEVKATEGDSLYLTAVESHQRGWLDRCWQAGGVSILTVVMARSVFVCPWADVRSLTKLGPVELAPFAVGPQGYLERFVRRVA